MRPGSRLVWKPSGVTLAPSVEHLEGRLQTEDQRKASNFSQSWYERIRRANLLLLPVNDKGHLWILLVLERTGGVGDHRRLSAPRPPLLSIEIERNRPHRRHHDDSRHDPKRPLPGATRSRMGQRGHERVDLRIVPVEADNRNYWPLHAPTSASSTMPSR